MQSGLSKVSPDCTEVRFASFPSGGFTTMAVLNQPKRKLAKRTSVDCAYLAVNAIIKRSWNKQAN